MQCLFLSDRYQKKCLGVFLSESVDLPVDNVLELPTIQPSNLFETGVIHWKPCLFFLVETVVLGLG